MSNTPSAATAASADILDELDSWLAANWDPDLTVAEWWQRLGTSGWAAPSLPTTAYGRDLSRNDAMAVAQRIAAPRRAGRARRPGHAAGRAHHRDPRHTRADRAVRAADRHRSAGVVPVVQRARRRIGSGRVWARAPCATATSGSSTGRRCGRRAARSPTWECSIARTNPEVPKHQGISWFAFDMHQPAAVDVRPLREMTGRALFNEVFLSDARVGDDALIGGVNNGWAVANTTLAYERSGLERRRQ